MSHPSLFTLACAHCSAPLELGPTVDQFECDYCGVKQLVVHVGERLQPRLIEHITNSDESFAKKAAAELAILRLEKELSEKYAEQMRLQAIVAQQAASQQAAPPDVASLILGVGGILLLFGTLLYQSSFDAPYSLSQGMEASITGFVMLSIALVAIYFSFARKFLQENVEGRLPDEPTEEEKEFKKLNLSIHLLQRKIETNRKIVNG